MNLGLRTLLADIIDYAGLFPPALLELDEAIRKFAQYQQSPESAFLARFVCPVSKISLVQRYLDELFRQNPLRLSLLGRGGEGTAGWATAVAEDLQSAIDLSRQAGSSVRVEAFEVRAAGAILEAGAESALPELAESLAAIRQLEGCRIYFEIPLTGDWRAAAPRAISCIRQFSTRFELPLCGVKLRCGGVEPAAFPTADQIASVIVACRDLQTPLKFTAGLHHPTPRYDPGVRARMHGFLNVFLAAILAHTLHLDFPDILAIVEENDPRHFHFSNEFAGWNQAEATVREIEYARRAVAVSFGSCSFDEPLADLRALGLL